MVEACRGTGVSIAAVALEHRLNANLLRRWLDQSESARGLSVGPTGCSRVRCEPVSVPQRSRA
ncbi:protein of unknown function (plasmid) [Pararobbsia alpina]